MIRCNATNDQLRARAENFNRVAAAKGPALTREIAADNRDALLELLAFREREAAVKTVPQIMAPLLDFRLVTDDVLTLAVDAALPDPVQPHALGRGDSGPTQGAGFVERSEDRGHVVASFSSHGESLANNSVDALCHDGATA